MQYDYGGRGGAGRRQGAGGTKKSGSEKEKQRATINNASDVGARNAEYQQQQQYEQAEREQRERYNQWNRERMAGDLSVTQPGIVPDQGRTPIPYNQWGGPSYSTMPQPSQIPGPAAQARELNVTFNPWGFTPEQLGYQPRQLTTERDWNQWLKYGKSRLNIGKELAGEIAGANRYTPTYMSEEQARQLGAWAGGTPYSNPNPASSEQYGYKMFGTGGGPGSPGWALDIDKGYVRNLSGQTGGRWWMPVDWGHMNRQIRRGGGGLKSGNKSGGYSYNPSPSYTPYGYLYKALMNWRV